MSIEKFTVNNFRCIPHLELDMKKDPLITIVGQNESGKTSLLQAIAWWGGDPESKVTPEDIVGEEEQRTKILNSEQPIVIAEVQLPIEDAKIVIAQLDPSILSTKTHESEEIATIDTWIVGRLLNGKYVFTKKASGKVNSYGVEKPIFDILFPRFIYYDVFEEYIEENKIPWSEVLTRPGWKNIAAILDIDQAKHQEIDGFFKSKNLKKLKQYETSLTQVITDEIHAFWDGTPKRIDISLNMNQMGVHCVTLDEAGNEIDYLDPSQMSAGFRWAFCLNTKLMTLKKEEPNRPLFLLLDEPNTTLSGDQQKKVLKHFEDFCEKGNSIIFATHSPFMVNLKKRILLMETKDNRSSIQSLAHLRGPELLITLRGALNLTLAASLFFGTSLLVVEGLTDRGHLQLIAENWLIEHNVSILETDGTSKLLVKLKELEREGLLQDSTVI